MSESKRYFKKEYDGEEIRKLKRENEQLKEEVKELEEENRELKAIFLAQLEVALEISFVKEQYCNALLTILDEEDSLESAKQYINEYY